MKLLSIFVTLLFLTQITQAQWATDTTIRNPICTAAGTQYKQQLCNDGSNGAFIVWDDLRKTENAYAQHIDSAGYIQWALNGIPLNDTLQGDGSVPTVATDTKNGAFVAWQHDVIGGSGHIIVNRINKSGTSVWGGSKEITPINDNRSPFVTSDRHGGVIVNWYAYFGPQIFIQWLDSAGKTKFATGGLQVSFGGAAHYGSELVSDNNYNAYILFGDYDTLRIVKVDSGGNFPWGQHGKVLSTSYDNYANHYDITYDGNDGVIVAWSDIRNSPTRDDLYAQRVTSSGNFLWGAKALLVDSLTTVYNTNETISADGNGGAYVCIGYTKLYMEHVSVTGAVSWKAPVPVTTNTTGQNDPTTDADGYGGVIAAWDDGRDGTSVYAQRIDSNGKYLWQSTGSPVHTAYIPGYNTNPKIISLHNGYAIAAMGIDAASVDIYAARFTGHPDINTGITLTNSNNGWAVYPNPSAGTFYVLNKNLNSSDAAVQVFNSVGQLMLEQKIKSSSFTNQQISLPNASKGVYMVKIISGNEVQNYKLVIE